MPRDAHRFGIENPQAILTRAYLTRLAEIACYDEAAEVDGWTHEPVHGGFGGAIGGTALYRFKLALASGRSHSLILKILFPRPGETPESPYYWKREYEIYRAGLLENLPANTVRLPRIYAVEDHGPACWIWMEDIRDKKDRWTLNDYADFAERLGRFNGAWLLGRALPEADWLSQSWHAAIAPALGDAFAQLDNLLEHPLARIGLPCAAKDEIMAIWQDREIFRQALAGLPRTFCHFDAFRRNVLTRGDELVLIDWALAGIGAPGEDLVSLVAVSLYYRGYSEIFASELDERAFAGYMKGLRAAGWRGDADLARIGYTCGMTLRGLAGVKQDINHLLDKAIHAEQLAIHEMERIEDLARLFAEIRQFRLLRMAREARTLLAR